MIQRQTLLRTALAASLLAATLGGCAALNPSSNVAIYEATLSGGQEVPAAATPATGSGEFMFNKGNNTLSWKVTYSGLSGPANAAHIHGPAAPGANAGVMVPFTGNMNAQPIQGEKVLTPEQAAALANGLTYVNIHTAKFPGGEIRGQLRPRR